MSMPEELIIFFDILIPSYVSLEKVERQRKHNSDHVFFFFCPFPRQLPWLEVKLNARRQIDYKKERKGPVSAGAHNLSLFWAETPARGRVLRTER